MMRTCLLASCLAAVTLGCGGATYSPPSQTVTPVNTPFKTAIEGVAKTGEIGSAGADLEAQFEELKKSDAAKAEAVEAEFKNLLKADGNPARVKQLATELAKKL
uniref:Uncharacterized protein n=1 Tax=Schlesneria paludicola TaxID=360056 RepID=A0A7C4QPW2_9PLAN